MRIYILVSIQFYESISYYDTSHDIADEYDNNEQLGDIQNWANDAEFEKVMTRSQAMTSNAKSAYPTLQS